MARKNIAREYFFGVASPVGYTKKGQVPTRRAREDAQASKFYSQQFRRSHVQLFIVLFLGFNFAGLFRDSTVATWTLAASLLIPIFLIRASIYSLADLPSSELDEREQVISESAFAHAYKIFFFIALAAFLIAGAWNATLTAHQFLVIGTSTIALMYVLPSAMLAWTLKDA